MTLVHRHATPIKPKRVVVLTAGGFVGGAIHARVAREGAETLALTRAQVDLIEPGAGAALSALLRPRGFGRRRRGRRSGQERRDVRGERAPRAQLG